MQTADLVSREPGFVDAIRLAWRTLLRGISRPIATSIGAVLFALGVRRRLGVDGARLRPRLRVACQRDGSRSRHDASAETPAPRVRVGRRFHQRTAVPRDESHDLYPGLMKKNPRGALESFRETSTSRSTVTTSSKSEQRPIGLARHVSRSVTAPSPPTWPSRSRAISGLSWSTRTRSAA